MQWDVQYIMIVDKSHEDTAQDLSEFIAPSGSRGNFAITLTSDGNAPNSNTPHLCAKFSAPQYVADVLFQMYAYQMGWLEEINADLATWVNRDDVQLMMANLRWWKLDMRPDREGELLSSNVEAYQGSIGQVLTYADILAYTNLSEYQPVENLA